MQNLSPFCGWLPACRYILCKGEFPVSKSCASKCAFAGFWEKVVKTAKILNFTKIYNHNHHLRSWTVNLSLKNVEELIKKSINGQ